MRQRLDPVVTQAVNGLGRGPASWLLVTATASCVAALVAGCGASAAQRAAVKVADAMPEGCKRIGAVQASANRAPTAEGNMEAARDALRGQAAELGANVVVIEKTEDKEIVVRLAGTAYQCP